MYGVQPNDAAEISTQSSRPEKWPDRKIGPFRFAGQA
jgi:hypothetical protein